MLHKLVVSTQLNNMLQNGFIFPKDRGETKIELPPPSLLNINMSNGKWHMGWPFKGWYPPSFFCHEVFASWVGPVSLETWKVFGTPNG